MQPYKKISNFDSPKQKNDVLNLRQLVADRSGSFAHSKSGVSNLQAEILKLSQTPLPLQT